MKINSFRNEHFFLSNFYEAPVTYDGLTYQNNEAAFQAQKCADPKERDAFTAMNPSESSSTKLFLSRQDTAWTRSRILNP